MKVRSWARRRPWRPDTGNSGENLKRRRFLFARDALRQTASSFRRVHMIIIIIIINQYLAIIIVAVIVWIILISSNNNNWQQYAGTRPASLWQVVCERQGSLQHVADFCLDIEMIRHKRQRSFWQLLADIYANIEQKKQHTWQHSFQKSYCGQTTNSTNYIKHVHLKQTAFRPRS